MFEWLRISMITSIAGYAIAGAVGLFAKKQETATGVPKSMAPLVLGPTVSGLWFAYAVWQSRPYNSFPVRAAFAFFAVPVGGIGHVFVSAVLLGLVTFVLSWFMPRR